MKPKIIEIKRLRAVTGKKGTPVFILENGKYVLPERKFLPVIGRVYTVDIYEENGTLFAKRHIHAFMPVGKDYFIPSKMAVYRKVRCTKCGYTTTIRVAALPKLPNGKPYIKRLEAYIAWLKKLKIRFNLSEESIMKINEAISDYRNQIAMIERMGSEINRVSVDYGALGRLINRYRGIIEEVSKPVPEYGPERTLVLKAKEEFNKIIPDIARESGLYKVKEIGKKFKIVGFADGTIVVVKYKEFELSGFEHTKRYGGKAPTRIRKVLSVAVKGNGYRAMEEMGVQDSIIKKILHREIG